MIYCTVPFNAFIILIFKLDLLPWLLMNVLTSCSCPVMHPLWWSSMVVTSPSVAAVLPALLVLVEKPICHNKSPVAAGNLRGTKEGCGEINDCHLDPGCPPIFPSPLVWTLRRRQASGAIHLKWNSHCSLRLIRLAASNTGELDVPVSAGQENTWQGKETQVWNDLWVEEPCSRLRPHLSNTHFICCCQKLQPVSVIKMAPIWQRRQ